MNQYLTDWQPERSAGRQQGRNTSVPCEYSGEVAYDLRRRIAATRWPDKETVDDRSQGAQLAKLQELVHAVTDD